MDILENDFLFKTNSIQLLKVIEDLHNFFLFSSRVKGELSQNTLTESDKVIVVGSFRRDVLLCDKVLAVDVPLVHDIVNIVFLETKVLRYFFQPVIDKELLLGFECH
jgi:hypothetical protein